MNVKELLEEGAGPELISRLFHIERYAWMALSYDMAVALDMDGCILAANSAWQRSTGLWPEALRGQYLLEFMDFDDRERVLAAFQDLITSDAASTTFDFRFRCGAGQFKRFNWNVIYFPDTAAFYCIVKDLSNVHDLHHAAYHDTLTGLPNRLFLKDALPKLVGGALERRHVLGLYFVDLDGFKTVNDTLGHQAGDVLLQTVAERLRRCAALPDRCVRLGGDEFVLLETWPCETHEPERLANEILAAVNLPVCIDGREVRVGASLGVALAPSAADTPGELMALADKAMYSAKRSGKNRFVLAPAAPPAGGPACTKGLESQDANR
jgi:diguanylate cyclase (GGDEF)-like protein/PAS domain S-box-containing protein